MRAAVYHGRADIRIEEMPMPRPAPGELLLRVLAVGVCGTDAKEYVYGPSTFPITHPHPVTRHVGPMIPGHEFVGEVVATAAGVEDSFPPGALVVSGAGISCGVCHWCRHGRTNLCARYATVGLDRHGALAGFVAVPAAICLNVSGAGLSADTLALAQPMSIAVHATQRGRPEAGDAVVVIGIGGIGTFITHVAVNRGLKVVAVDIDRGRLDIAARLGAAHIVDSEVDPVPEFLRREDLIATVVYEASGTPAGLETAQAAVMRGGRLVLVGLQPSPVPVALEEISLREIELIGTNAHVFQSDLPRAVALLGTRAAGWSDIAPVARPLSELVSGALEPLVTGRLEVIKMLIDPWINEARPTAT